MIWLGIGLIVVLLLGGLWWHHQNAPLAPGSLARRAPLPALMRLRRTTVLAFAAVLLLLSLGTVYLVRALWPSFKRAPATVSAPPPQGRTSPAAFLEKFPAEYAMVAQKTLEKPAEKPPLPPKGVPVEAGEPGLAHAIPAPLTQPQPAPPLSRGDVEAMIAKAQRESLAQQQAMLNDAVRQVLAGQAQTSQTVRHTPEAQAQHRAQQQEDADRAKRRKGWTSSPPTSIQVAHESPQESKEKGQEKAQSLIRDAVWAKPAQVERTLYVDQFIPGILQDAVNSDIPGQLRVKVMRDVVDRNLRGIVLIPQLSTVVGALDGTPEYGQSRIKVTLNQIIFPDGTVLELAQTVLGAPDGSTGVEARVNNHWLKLIAGVGLSAVLNIGVQSIAGTPGPGAFYRDPSQQAAQDAAQQLNTDAKKIIERQLKVPPTLTVNAGQEVTLHLSQNINLAKAPVVVR